MLIANVVDMGPKVTLKYFPLRGRGELIRLILKAGEIDFDEKLLTFEAWPAEKPS